MTQTNCIVILTADHAWTENNGKIGLSGIFDSFTFPAFPAQVFPFAIFLRLSNLKQGKNNLVINFIEEKTLTHISSINAELVSTADQEIFQIWFQNPAVIIKEPGVYTFTLTCNDIQIGRHSLTTNQITPTEQK